MTTTSTDMKKRFEASMVLAAAGDAIGYRGGRWEFLKDGPRIHQQFREMGGFSGVHVNNTRFWVVSDDTVMHLATAEALVEAAAATTALSFKDIMTHMTRKYSNCMSDMQGRGPGIKCMISLSKLEDRPETWDQMVYDKAGGGCGGSMRAMCIGLRFAGQQNRSDLVRYAVESARITHNHVNGFMGAVVSAAFTAYAIEDIPAKKWGNLLITDLIPQVEQYCHSAGRDWTLIQQDMHKFSAKFQQYMRIRNVVDGDSEPVFPDNYGIKERDDFYRQWSYDGWAGASGDDSVIIAYDAVLGAKDNWETLVERGVLHYGDNDSTGTICCAWYGAAHGYPDAKYKNNWEGIEYESRLIGLADRLFDLNAKTSQ